MRTPKQGPETCKATRGQLSLGRMLSLGSDGIAGIMMVAWLLSGSRPGCSMDSGPYRRLGQYGQHTLIFYR